MKTTIDYSNSPAKNFDALEDIKEYLGGRYDEIAQEMKKIRRVDHFAFYCDLAGISGFPVQAWYDHFWGEGAYMKAWRAMGNEDFDTFPRDAMKESI